MSELKIAEWDTQNFGFPVAHLPESSEKLWENLAIAQNSGVRLAYWQGPHGTKISDETLTKFYGQCVDRKVTYIRKLTMLDSELVVPSKIIEYPCGPACFELQRLGIAAGGYSRFMTDKKFPWKLFQKMYRVWTDRSAKREIADVVYVVRSEDSGLLGMVTVVRDGTSGSIGLIAVDSHARGRGLGQALMQAAAKHLAQRGCQVVRVTTQVENRAACSLYERAGYRIESIRDVYHFWPQAS